MTPPEPESDEVPDEEWLEESLLKKLDLDDHRELPEELELLLQLVIAGAGAAAPGTVAPGTVAGGGLQFGRGVSV